MRRLNSAEGSGVSRRYESFGGTRVLERSNILSTETANQKREKADPGRIVTHRFPLSEMVRALEAMEAPDRIKVMILP